MNNRLSAIENELDHEIGGSIKTIRDQLTALEKSSNTQIKNIETSCKKLSESSGKTEKERITEQKKIQDEITNMKTKINSNIKKIVDDIEDLKKKNAAKQGADKTQVEQIQKDLKGLVQEYNQHVKNTGDEISQVYEFARPRFERIEGDIKTVQQNIKNVDKAQLTKDDLDKSNKQISDQFYGIMKGYENEIVSTKSEITEVESKVDQ